MSAPARTDPPAPYPGDVRSHDVQVRDRLFLGGDWETPMGEGTAPVVDPFTGSVVGRFPLGDVCDVDRAVAAARAAAPLWARTAPAERADVVDRLREGLARRGPELARSITCEVGMPYQQSLDIQVGVPVRVLAALADAARRLRTEEAVGTSLVVRAPAGVAACITPWNYPLFQVAAKVGAAMLAGCAVVLKPSEVAPLTAFAFAEAAAEAGVPPGVLNVVTGSGRAVGEALVAHEGVDVVSFTGSTEVGRQVAAIAGRGLKRVTLELGGKSPMIALAGAPFEEAVRFATRNCFRNAGQTCTALSRLLVPAERVTEAVAIAADEAGGYTLGDPFDPAVDMGPLASRRQRDRVLSMVAGAIADGAVVAHGGPLRDGGDGGRGWFVPPTVLHRVDPRATIAQEEVFGPVLVVLGYKNEDDAVRIANGTRYGLAAHVWAAERTTAERVARRIEAGQVDVNGGGFDPEAPFGGRKDSGFGRELGRYGLEEFIELQAIRRGA